MALWLRSKLWQGRVRKHGKHGCVAPGQGGGNRKKRSLKKSLRFSKIKKNQIKISKTTGLLLRFSFNWKNNTIWSLELRKAGCWRSKLCRAKQIVNHPAHGQRNFLTWVKTESFSFKSFPFLGWKEKKDPFDFQNCKRWEKGNKEIQRHISVSLFRKFVMSADVSEMGIAKTKTDLKIWLEMGWISEKAKHLLLSWNWNCFKETKKSEGAKPARCAEKSCLHLKKLKKENVKWVIWINWKVALRFPFHACFTWSG